MRTTGDGEPDNPQPTASEEAAERVDDRCWVCGAAVVHRNCKIICPRCGFMRDCSDP